MNCRSVRKRVSAVPRGAEEPAVREHLARCAACRRFVAAWQTVAEELAAPRAEVLPDAGFAARVAAALPERTESLAWAARRLMPAAVALALVLLGWCWLATPPPSELVDSASTDDVLVLLIHDGGNGG
jgi:predicted anti-sigma-YlaC factor YlaD